MANQPVEQVDERGNLPSASSLDADVRCLGRRNLIEKTGAKSERTAAADRGTRIHEVLEGVKELESLSNSDKITAGILMNQEAETVEKYGFEASEVLKEKRIWLTKEGEFEPVFSGKPDKVHVHDGRILNVNYKTGFSFVVPIEKNWQVRSEAVLLADQHEPKEIVSVLIHPHHPDSLRQEIRFKPSTLETYKQTLLYALEEMKNPGAPRTPNSISCMYCPAKKSCPEHKQWVEFIYSGTGAQPMAPEVAGQRLKDIKYAIKNLEEEEASFKETLKADPNSVAGWKLVPSTKREINDTPKAIQEIDSTWGVDIRNHAVTISLTKLENAVHSKKKADNSKFTKEKAKEEISVKLGTIISKVTQEPKLLQTSD